MGTWSEEFVNVRNGVIGPLHPWLRGRAESYRLSGVTPQSPTTIVYFPPGRWGITLEPYERLVLPEQIELRFAPGARLAPTGLGATLEIQGKLTAPVGPVFIPYEDQVPVEPLADIALTSPLLERVHPEWWGAGRLHSRRFEDVGRDERRAIARLDTYALQTAIQVAMFGTTSMRPGPASAALQRRTGAVLELLGSYLLDRPLHAWGLAVPRELMGFFGLSPPVQIEGTTDGPVFTLEVQGRPRWPGDPTLRAIDGFEGDALLKVTEIASLRVRHVTFEAPRPEVACVSMAGSEPAPERVAQLPHEFSHCRFQARGGSNSLRGDLFRVRLAQAPRAAREPGEHVFTTVALVPAVQFEGCVFDAEASLASAIRLRGGGTISGADFRGCTFVGAAKAMIDATAFNVSAMSCRFENRVVHEALKRVGSNEIAAVMRLHWKEPEGGVDIFLGQEFLPHRAAPAKDEYKYYALVELGRLAVDTVLPPNIPDLGLNPPAFAGPIGSVTAQDCRSTSPQFLVTAEPALDTPPMRDATLIGLHHHFPFGEPGVGATVRPPAIHWRCFRPPQPVASLVLIGCRFDGAPGRINRIVVGQGEPDNPSVFDYGILIGEQDIVINNASTRTSNVISPANLGVVPPGG